MPDVSTWILRMDEPGSGPRVAIKDLIDVAGTPTTAACRVLAATAEPAVRDAACMAPLRAADVAIVGKTNLHELACGGTGVNPHYGTPVNPLDPTCIPGGSSSGNAVALAAGEVDIAIGSDTAGSIRNPSACCGTVGLKTTWGRIPLEGVWPLAPSLDTLGPMARDVAGTIAGMALLEPGFVVADRSAPVVGRVRIPDVDPAIDAAVDAALAASEVDVVDVALPGWDAANDAGWAVMFHEYWLVDRHLYERDPGGLGADIVERIEQGRDVTVAAYELAPGPPGRVARRAGGGLRPRPRAGVADHRHVPHADRRPGAQHPSHQPPRQPRRPPEPGPPGPRRWPLPGQRPARRPRRQRGRSSCATGLVVEAAARTLA